MTIYEENGYANREDYLHCLSEDHGVPLMSIKAIADVLGSGEDFDGLVVMIESACE